MSILNVKTTTAGFQQQKQQFSLKRFNFLNFPGFSLNLCPPTYGADRERQKYRERQRETERQRDRETERQRGRERQRETDF